MNKRTIVIAAVFLVLFVVGTASVFADDTEYEYKVTVYYTYTFSNGRTEQRSREYTIWASSAREAEAEAQRLCNYDYGDVASCGGARATGRSR